VFFAVLLCCTSPAGAENNVEFLKKSVINNLKFSVVEVAVPKIESEKYNMRKNFLSKALMVHYHFPK
jgi:hypothetical protein